MARTAEDEAGTHRFGEALSLSRDFLLILSREVDEMVVLGTDEEGDRRLVEATALPVPLLDGVEGAFPRQVEHKQDGDGVVADKWQHVDEFTLAAKIPD